ncbi:Hypothetical protein KLENKIAIHU_2108 [Klenkia terrae]|nr:hypothetical protein [Klenkia terrae]SSC23509.1 Hypothetical protein KLENKIAIHU_2108 [Klenkia terrae]
MTWGRFRPDENKAVPAYLVNPRFEIKTGDLLVSRANTSEYVGAPVVVGATRPRLLLSDKSMRLSAVPGTNPAWLRYMLMAPSARRQIEARATGTSDSMRNISQAGLLAVQLPDCPDSEQRRIVELLEDHFSRLDAADSYLSASLDRLSRLETAQLSALMEQAGTVRDLGLADLLEVPLTNGRSVPTRQDGFPVLRLTAIRSSTVDTTHSKGGDWSVDEARPFLVEKGDFLVARGNGTLRLVGRGALVDAVPEEVAFPDTMIRIRPDVTRLHPEFLRLVWNAPRVRRQIEAQARTTAGIYKINQQHVRGIRLDLPDLPGQHRVVADMSEAIAARNRVHEALHLARRRSSALRRGLLEAAFTGRLPGQSSDVDLAGFVAPPEPHGAGVAR